VSAAQTTAAREVFTTSRLAEFCTRRELEKQTGHSADDWPAYVLKELLDNALDAAEEAEIAPKIAIDIDTDRITVTDNGPGMAAETVKRLLDLSSRTSARARYVSPTRGAQGQALSTILVMPYALARESGAAVVIEAHDLAHRIAVHVNKLTEEPRLVHEVSTGSGKSGTRISVEWPQSASTILDDARPGFLPLVLAYVVSNPHLSVTLRTPDGEWSDEAIDPAWRKWRACDPTSSHWYSVETFRRLVGAYVQKDQGTGRRRPLREFLELFDGLTSTIKRSKRRPSPHCFGPCRPRPSLSNPKGSGLSARLIYDAGSEKKGKSRVSSTPRPWAWTGPACPMSSKARSPGCRTATNGG
jgi:hypothetical protein